MATDIKIVLGYVEQQTVRARSRAANKTSNVKDAAAERIAELVGGTAVGRGVENTDDMKAGYLTPEIRMDILRSRIEGFDARLAAMGTEIVIAAQEDTTSLKLQGMDDAIRALRARREKAVGDLVSIMRGLAEGDDE